MFRLSKLTDYAVVLLGQMSRTPGRVASVAQLAEQTGVPAPTVAKVLKSLAATGLVRSQRGAQGGYALGPTAEQISIAAIIRALDGPIALTACVTGSDDNCTVESLCPMRGHWNRVNVAVNRALESVSLAEMIDGTQVFFPEPAAGRSPGISGTQIA